MKRNGEDGPVRAGGLTFFNQPFHHFLHLLFLSLELLSEIHPLILVILPPFGIQFGLENIECLERIEESRFQFRIACERYLELGSQGDDLGNAINVGLEVGVTR